MNISQRVLPLLPGSMLCTAPSRFDEPGNGKNARAYLPLPIRWGEGLVLSFGFMVREQVRKEQETFHEPTSAERLPTFSLFPSDPSSIALASEEGERAGVRGPFLRSGFMVHVVYCSFSLAS